MAWSLGSQAWLSTVLNQESGSAEAGLEPESMRNGLVLRFTGVGLVLGYKVKLGTHFTLLPSCGG